MKVTEIISENVKKKFGQKFAGLFFGLSRKQVVEKIAQKWALEIEAAISKGVPPRLSSVSKELPPKMRGDSTILQDARSMANSIVAQRVGMNMFQAWNAVASWATTMGIGYAFYNLVTGLYEDAQKYKGTDFQQAAQIRVDRFVAEAAAAIVVKGAGYIFKLPVGLQPLLGWVPGVTKLTNTVAALGPTAVAALNVWLATPEGRKAVAEFFVGTSLATSALQGVRAWAGGYLKEKSQFLIDKIQDFADPKGAAARQPERDQRAAAIQARDKDLEITWDPKKDPRNQMLSRDALKPSN